MAIYIDYQAITVNLLSNLVTALLLYILFVKITN